MGPSERAVPGYRTLPPSPAPWPCAAPRPPRDSRSWGRGEQFATHLWESGRAALGKLRCLGSQPRAPAASPCYLGSRAPGGFGRLVCEQPLSMANSPPTDVSPSRGLAGGEWGVGKWGEACPDELHFPSILAGARWHLEQPRLASLAELGMWGSPSWL